MESIYVLTVSLAVAALLYRGLEQWRPVEIRTLSYAIAAAMAVPMLIAAVGGAAHAIDANALRFAAFSLGVLLIGYMFVAGAWALRFLAEQLAAQR
jgi:hypothetical protein